MGIPTVFIDDSGNPDFISQENPGSTSFLIFTALIVTDGFLNKFRHEASLIRRKYFGEGEIKGSRIGKDKRRRNSILDDVGRLPVRYYTIVIDKHRFFSEGGNSSREETYTKGLILLLTRLFQAIGYFECFIDDFGTKDFQKRFLSSRFFDERRTIFSEVRAEFRSSISSIGIQIADIISNSMFYCYEQKNPNHILAPIKKCEYAIEIWPPKPQKFDDLRRIPSDSRWNVFVSRYALTIASDYISQNSGNPSLEIIARIETLRLLRTHALNFEADSYIKSETIIRIKNLQEYDVSTSSIFMSKIIAPLRDAGVIIASSNNGYKLPTSVDDIDDFVEKVGGEVMPYLRRLQMARRGLLAATNRQYDAVSMEKSMTLSRMMLLFDNENIEIA